MFTKIRETITISGRKRRFWFHSNIYNSNGQCVFSTDHDHSTSWTSEEKIVFESNITPSRQITSIVGNRRIDTRSWGRADFKVEAYDEHLGDWIHVLYKDGFRTSRDIGEFSYRVSPIAFEPKIDAVSIRKIKLHNCREFVLTDHKNTSPSLAAKDGNNKKFYGNLVTFNPGYKTLKVHKDSKIYYLSNELSNEKFNYERTSNQYDVVHKGSHTFYMCYGLKTFFQCDGHHTGSHKGRNRNGTGNVTITVKNMSGSVIDKRIYTFWKYIGGDNQQYINFHKFSDLNYNKAVNITLDWNFDCGGYVAHIWGGRNSVSVVRYVKLYAEAH